MYKKLEFSHLVCYALFLSTPMWWRLLSRNSTQLNKQLLHLSRTSGISWNNEPPLFPGWKSWPTLTGGLQIHRD